MNHVGMACAADPSGASPANEIGSERTMMKALMSAIVSMSLIGTSALAQSSLPATSPASTASPAQERIDGQQAMPDYAWWIIGAVVLGGLILLLVLDGGDDDDLPASP